MKDDQRCTLLLDLDGTLVVSESVAGDCIEDVFTELNVPGGAQHRTIIWGRTWLSAAIDLEKLFPHIPQATWEHHMRQAYLSRIEQGVQVIPGVIEALQKIHEFGHKLILVTGSQFAEVEMIFRRFGFAQWFERVFTAESYTQGKPSPEPYLTAVMECSLDKENCIVFEDSPAGIQSSMGAELPFVQVGYVEPKLERHSHALDYLHDWTEVDGLYVQKLLNTVHEASKT